MKKAKTYPPVSLKAIKQGDSKLFQLNPEASKLLARRGAVYFTREEYYDSCAYDDSILEGNVLEVSVYHSLEEAITFNQGDGRFPRGLDASRGFILFEEQGYDGSLFYVESVKSLIDLGIIVDDESTFTTSSNDNDISLLLI